jgi:hypothetical protein
MDNEDGLRTVLPKASRHQWRCQFVSAMIDHKISRNRRAQQQ